MTGLASPGAEAGVPAGKHVPAPYWVWLAGASCSMVGTHVMAFALAWSATVHGGLFAGLVLTMVVLPRTVLSLAGGAMADRFGAWRVMLAGDAVMVLVMLSVAAASWKLDTPAILLPAAALAIGLVDAFYLPSSGAVPRLLVAGEGLARATSARQMVNQAAALVGAPLGGLVVATAGLAAAALANAVTFSVMLIILMVLRRGRDADGDPAGPDGDGLWRRCVNGLTVAVGDPLLRPALVLVVGAAAFLLPLSPLLVPLLAHERNWTSGSAGAIVGAIAAGTVVVAVMVTVRGSGNRPGIAAAVGVLLSACATAFLAMTSGPALAVVAGALVGLGNGVFATHVAPLILGHAPRGYVSRVQAVVVMAQSLPVLVTNNALGALADGFPVGAVIFACALSLSGCAGAALASEPLRHAGRTPATR